MIVPPSPFRSASAFSIAPMAATRYWTKPFCPMSTARENTVWYVRFERVAKMRAQE